MDKRGDLSRSMSLHCLFQRMEPFFDRLGNDLGPPTILCRIDGNEQGLDRRAFGGVASHREDLLLFFTLNREDFSFVIHLDRQPRTSRRREAQTGSRARSGSRSERTLDAVEHSRTLMEWWPFLIFHRGGLRIKVINNTCLLSSDCSEASPAREAGVKDMNKQASTTRRGNGSLMMEYTSLRSRGCFG